MRYSIEKVSALVLLLLCAVPAGWARYGKYSDSPSQKKGKNQQGDTSLSQPKPGEVAPGGPAVTKEELAAYKLVYAARGGDPNKLIELGEAFVAKFPDSQYAGGVYSELTGAYLQTNQPDKMLVAGGKAIDKNPDNVDVLPLLAWAIPRRATAPDQFQKAEGYAHHGIELLNAMVKPADMDDASFEKAKNDKLALCHDGLGVAAARTGKYEAAIPELTESLQLSANPDPVDYYLLGLSDEQGSHFSDAIAAFTKCASNGPMQGQCKGLLEETKKKSENSLDVPR